MVGTPCCFWCKRGVLPAFRRRHDSSSGSVCGDTMRILSQATDAIEKDRCQDCIHCLRLCFISARLCRFAFLPRADAAGCNRSQCALPCPWNPVAQFLQRHDRPPLHLFFQPDDRCPCSGKLPFDGVMYGDVGDGDRYVLIRLDEL